MIEIYLGTFAGGWAVDGSTQAWAEHVGPAHALERWVQAIEELHASRWRRASVVLWLSGGLARPFLCGPVAGLTSWREAETFAAAAASEATGIEGVCHVQLEDWPGDESAVCTATEASLAATIQSIPRRRRIVWHSVRPRWAAALDEALSQRPSLRLVAFAEDDALTMFGGLPADSLVTANHGLESASTYAPAPSANQSMAIWHRAMLSLDVPAEDAWFARLDEVPPPEDGRGNKEVEGSCMWLSATRQAEEPTS